MATSEKKKGKLQSSYKFFIGGFLLIVVLLAVILYFYDGAGSTLFNTPNKEVEYSDINEVPEKIENGIHVRTGFIEADGMQEVINNCTNCHSAKLVTQNRMSKEGWTATIRWMQKTQNLWDLGDNEGPIVEYLAKNYGPIKKGRREVLKDIEWYPLK
ncbi:monoheme cytochrome C [Flavobacteriaceae bacterium KMM 6897]|nr:monoheme cytochrome C [Flavobacteriaceae bacterium KMM 6897]